MARLDPHSYADDAQPRMRRFDWHAHIDFTRRVIDGRVTLEFDASARPCLLDLDTRALTIHSVTSSSGPLPHTLYAEHPVLGSRLEINVPRGLTHLTITYTTSAHASALQWLEPTQTLGKKEPFLFSQCQAIHARSIVPLQDSPTFRVPYRATLTIPKQLKAVMAAASVGRTENATHAIEQFDMPQPIPPYLLAFAVGDLASRDVSQRSRVWAEPAMVDAAAREFDGVEAMMTAAESLFGPYDWERFDILTMPPSFPYGGMENPRLTFVTPALVVGDKSLVDVIAHELAHSWTGNLVTNANAEHFWLNEGFTVYAERRITEATSGVEAATLSAALGRRELDEALKRFSARPELTRLTPSLEGVDPDEAFSVVPYEKGFLFLVVLERELGRVRFDVLLKKWLAQHRFGAVSTNDFVDFFERESPGLLARVGAKQWLDEPGVPASAPVFHSKRLEVLAHVGATGPDATLASGWQPAEWVLWLSNLPLDISTATLAEFDARLHLTQARNLEIAVAWLQVAIRAEYRPAFGRLGEVLGSTGRMKYLRPLYSALATPTMKKEARSFFDRYADRYHPIARHVLRELLET